MDHPSNAKPTSSKQNRFTGQQLRRHSPRKFLAVLRDLAKGNSFAAIARKRRVSTNTVGAIFRRFRAQLPTARQRALVRYAGKLLSLAERDPGNAEILGRLFDIRAEVNWLETERSIIEQIEARASGMPRAVSENPHDAP